MTMSAGVRMQRYRRLLVIDRLIPFLAALVALVAMAGMIVVELNSRAVRSDLSAQLAELKATLGQGASAAAAPAVSPDVAEKLSALTDRLAGLEGKLTTLETTAASAPAAIPGDTTAAGADAAAPATPTAAIDPSLPTTDCIPLGTRFIVTPGETYPLCQSKSVIKVGTITADAVEVQGAGAIVKTGFATLVGTKCTVMVFSADPAGFGELRVTCT